MRNPKISADEFAERVEKAYDGRISVVKETYTGTRYQVTAYCNIHKIYFEVKTARELGDGTANCPECSKIKIKQCHQNSFDDVLKRFTKSYGNRFTYDESTYCGMKIKMKVHCNECGEDFEITPEHHLKYNNGGCPNCHKTKITKCSKCGKEIVVDRRCRKNVICDDCKRIQKRLYKIKRRLEKNNQIINNEELIKEITYCKICGRKLNKHKRCENYFCNKHNYQIFNTLIKYFNFDKSKYGTIEVEEEFNRVRDMLYELYWNKHMSSKEICNIFNYPSIANLTAKVFKYLGIPSKNCSQSTSENFLMGRIEPITSAFNYKDGYHITWDSKRVYLRSSYEFDFAQMMDESKTLYEVEPFRIHYFDTQQQKERIAIPDFYLPETNTIVEVKSKWTFDKQNMIDRRNAYLKLGYDFKLLYEHKFVDLDAIDENKHNLEYFKRTK